MQQYRDKINPNRKRRERHGNAAGKKTPEYRCWVNIKKRCYNKAGRDYPYYGGRGITVCAAWRNSFNNFFAFMGKRPGPGYSIDRIDNNGDYEPGNCRWATRSQQMSNRRGWAVVS